MVHGAWSMENDSITLIMAFRILQPRSPLSLLAKTTLSWNFTIHNARDVSRAKLVNPFFIGRDGNVTRIEDRYDVHIITPSTMITVEDMSRSQTFWLKIWDTEDYYIFPTPHEVLDHMDDLTIPHYYYGQRVTHMDLYGFVTGGYEIPWDTLDYASYRIQTPQGPIRFALESTSTDPAPIAVASGQYILLPMT